MVFNKKTFILMLCVLFTASFYPASSFAHKVMIFGWVDGERINTISKFNGGKKVQNAPVSVYNSEGVLILKGTTDTGGEFSFELPEKEKALKVVLEASMGHKTSCIVEVEEASPTDVSDLLPQGPSTSKAFPNETPIEKIIEKAIDKKMTVILKLIVENEEKQKLSEIISGIGYIFGLIGVALWVRRK